MNKTLMQAYFYLVGIIFILGFTLIGWFMTGHTIPTDNKDIMNGIVETFKNGVILILGYFYGSSKGSADKNELMNKPPNTP